MAKKSKKEILELIKKLLSVTVERGASEQEALMAAERAAALMADYDLSQEEVEKEDRDDTVFVHERECDWQVAEHIGIVVNAIKILCSVDAWRDRREKPAKFNFIGVGPDPEIAAYLYDICCRAMISKAIEVDKEWRLLTKTHRYIKVRAHLRGMAMRLAKRIIEISWKQRRPTGNGLVPVKQALIDEALKKMDLNLVKFRIGGTHFNSDEFKKGVASADRVGLNNGVGGTAPVAALGFDGDRTGS